MQDAISIFMMLALVGVVGYSLRRLSRGGGGFAAGPSIGESSGESSGAGNGGNGGDAPAHGGSQGPPAGVAQELRSIAEQLMPVYQGAHHPKEILEQPLFLEGVSILTRPSISVETLLGYYTGDNALLAILALDALKRRNDETDVRERILDHVNDFVPWSRWFALRAVDALTPAGEEVIGRVLVRLDESWTHPMNTRVLREFLESRAARGEKPSFGKARENLGDADADALKELLERMPKQLAAGLRDELARWRAQHIDREWLDGVGRVWAGPGDATLDGPILPHDSLQRHVEQLCALLTRTPSRSALLIGEHGVGKSAAMLGVARRLAEQGWVIFQAGHAELIAGMIYIGQLEERLRELLDRISGRRVLWVVEDFHMLALSGRHQYGPMGALDFLVPYIERGDVTLIGETRPGAYERLVQSKPRVLTALETHRVDPLPESETLDLAGQWAAAVAEDPARPVVSAATLGESWMLAQQYLGDRAAPGNLLRLLDLARTRVLAERPQAAGQLGLDDVIEALGRLTGLPATVLDERQGLDLAGLRERFAKKVMGQPEAIDTLVERVAMIKAGVTDPTRPFGVFLFAGPTGTGKTEIAKALAEFLFGSAERMVRLDMSEFQDAESLNRIIGGPSSSGGPSEERAEAVTDEIRKQPFSVVLLDEFEKAHPNIWDLFLQVFDDGRLTDRAGNTADFRNAIVIMTSNLGSVIPSGASLGFSDATGRFNASIVTRAVERSFRKEFLNRIDRVVVFRPLGRETMREILRKELVEAFRRRGLRNRAWAVEWDASALEFLLERGFTADLGARPLRRAVERYVLAPLATTIVTHQYPEGDQFLFVRAEGDELVAEFVDPDAPDASGDAPGAGELGEAEPVEGEAVSLGRIALDPRGRPEEIVALRGVFELLRATVEDEAWQRAKHDDLEKTHLPEFWHRAERFSVLGNIEYLDRIEAGLRTAGSLLERLAAYGTPTRERYPRELVGRLASQLHLLDAACRGVRGGEPHEAFLLVEGWSETGTPSQSADTFARRIADMYRSWADKRRMQCEVLEASAAGDPYRVLLGIGGYAAFPILRPEQGLHLLEVPTGGKRVHKVAARVRVEPQPETPPADGSGGLAAQAREALAADGDSALNIVRRYREEPSPLVRDVVRGWRTGKLRRVLDGDFDLLGRDPREDRSSA